MLSILYASLKKKKLFIFVTKHLIIFHVLISKANLLFMIKHLLIYIISKKMYASDKKWL